jgi:hypothetical protein
MYSYLVENLDATNTIYFTIPSASKFERIEVAEEAAELYWNQSDIRRTKSVRVIDSKGNIMKEFSDDNNN